MKRIQSIDIVRGIVMIIMALDHVRDLLHVTSINDQPTNLATTTPALFVTRWVTHLCAPTFVFLSGVSAFISMQRTGDIPATRRFLLTRGLWLILLELTVVNFGLWFDVHFKLFLFNIIGAIGVCFIGLALLLTCSVRTIGITGLAILFLHNLAPLVPGGEHMLKKILMPLFAPGAFPFGGDRLFVIGYPPIPWLGIMLIGFACGRFFLKEEQKRKALFVKMGLAAIGLFIALRIINVYGDAPWTQQPRGGLFTILSFFNLTKYPPSLQFGLLFLGIMFLMLAAVQGVQNKLTNIASVYGKVPLFYFVVHWYIIHPLVFLMIYLQGFTVKDMEFGFNFGRPKTGSGLPLWAIYGVWIGIVAIMYPLCKWYGRYKEAHRHKKWTRFL